MNKQTENRDITIALCSHLSTGEGIRPLEPGEWTQLAEKLLAAHRQPADLPGMTEEEWDSLLGIRKEEAERFRRLLGRMPSLAFERERLHAAGIDILTRADERYPAALKRKLRQGCPPLFYCAGDLSLLDAPAVAIVGSRNASKEDLSFTENTAKRLTDAGYTIASGGAKGVDQTAAETAFRCGGSSVQFLADSLMRKIRSPETVQAIRSGRMLLLSAAKPDAGFNVGMAMQRNRYIYAQSFAAIVVRCDLQKGGTWAGATEDLRHKWAKLYCREDDRLAGNRALLRMGALPFRDGTDLSAAEQDPPQGAAVQPSLFDI